MDINNSPQLYTLEQLDQLIELPINQVVSCIRDIELCEVEYYFNEYTEFRGLVKPKDSPADEAFFVNGIFKVNKTEMVLCGDKFDPDAEAICVLIEIQGSKYSNSDTVKLDNIYEVITTSEQEIARYSYDEFMLIINRLKIPLIKEIPTEIIKFNYDPELINHKSNFTLEEASRIAANAPLKDQQGIFYSTSLLNHYQEIICECVKGQNQHGFHLLTIELWVHSHDDYEPCSRRHNNGTRLVVSANVNLELTIISKAELLRWCKYMKIETGLFYSQKIIDESVEALRIELNESEEEISRLRELYLSESGSTISKETYYPPELLLAIDAFELLCSGQDKPPTNEYIKEWLQKESKERGITHKDGSTELKGFSDIKLKTIPSIIKSQ